MNKIWTYSRVSTNKQDTSIDVQRTTLENYCNRRGFINVIHLVESDVSGGKSLFHRPEGSKLVFLEKDDWLIVSKHDRLFRETENGIRLVKKWFKAGVNIVFLNISEQPINIHNPAAKFSFFVMLCAAELEKDMIGLRTKEGLKNRKSNGQTNSAPKFGYDNRGKGKDGLEVINTEEQETLKLIHTLLKTMSAYKVADELNNRGITTKKGKKWIGSNIYKLVKNKNIAQSC